MSASTEPAPDLIVLADTIHTLADAPRTQGRAAGVTAIGITDGRISQIGDRADAAAWAGPDTRVVDHGSATVTPGLVDAHIHPVLGQAMARGGFLGDASTVAEVADALRQHAEGLDPDAWVIGWGLKQTVFGDAAPSAEFIEEALSGRRVFLTFFDGHASLASARALEECGVTAGRTLPDGSEVVADAAGRPTGFLREISAMDLVRSRIPERTFEELVDAVEATLRGMAEAGLTGGEMLDLENPESFAIFDAIEARGELPIKIRVAPWVLSKHELSEVDRVIELQGKQGRRYRVQGAKMMIDGTIDNGTAWLYRADSEGEGLVSLYSDPSLYGAALRRFDAAGVSTATHAIGDRGIRFVVDAIAGLPAGGPQHRIEHIEELDSDDLEALRTSGATASMQPTHCTHFVYADRSDAWSRRLGDDRADFAWRLRDVKDTGIALALGSDWPIAPFDPKEIMADARSRRRTKVAGSVPVQPAQALTALEALRGYTVDVYASSGEQGGTIEIGLPADLSVFSRDPLEASPEEFAQAIAVTTYVDGVATR